MAQPVAESRSKEYRNGGWAIVDQVISSATNFGGSILAARALPIEGFGAFAVGFAIYLLAMGVSRALSSEPLVIRYAASRRSEQRDAMRSAAGSALSVGVAIGVALAVLSRAFQGAIGSVLLAVGIFLPFLLLQDLWRFALIMQFRARAAAFNDLTWLGVMVLAFWSSTGTDPQPWLAFAFWSSGAAVGALLGIAQTRVVPTHAVLGWWRRHGDLGGRYVGEFMATVGVAYALTIGVAALGHPNDAAGLRGAQVLMGPMNILIMSIGALALPLMVRQAATGGSSDLSRSTKTVSSFLAASSVVWGSLILIIPDSVGERALGDSWLSSRQLLPLFIWSTLASGLTMGALLGLRSLGDAQRSFRLRILVSPLSIGFGFAGLALGGASGAMTGLALANSVAIPLWWHAFRVSLLEDRTSG